MLFYAIFCLHYAFYCINIVLINLAKARCTIKRDIMKKEKFVLAYSGGLDTSVIIPWLQDNYPGCEIIAVLGDVGQGDDYIELEKRALSSGANKFYALDLKEEFIKEYIYPTLKAGAVYEKKYLLGTSFARPIIAKGLVDIALKEKATAIVHGCTGKGNDQVRFELTIKAFAPHLKIIAPWRTWELKSREDEIAYAEKKNVKLSITRETNYSKDKNIWHLSHEGLDLEDPANEPQLDKILEMGVSQFKAKDEPTYVQITFEKGEPTAIDGKKLSPLALLEKLNKLGGENGIGISDIVENRLVGMKSRGVYETPGGSILYEAHDALEMLCLDKDTLHFKQHIALKYADLVYNGQWFTPLRESLDAFVNKTQENVTGEVKLKLYKGNIIYAGATSKYSLYNEEIATFGEGGTYNQKDSEGFINLFGLPITVAALLKEKLEKESK